MYNKTKNEKRKTKNAPTIRWVAPSNGRGKERRTAAITGFTMIETVVAFAVLTAAILGPLALVTYSLAQAKSARNKLIAVNLAQEGLELVRAIRDNNIICDTISSPPQVFWNHDPNGGGGARLGQGGSGPKYRVDATDFLPNALNCKAPAGPDVFIPTPNPIEDSSCDNAGDPNKFLKLNANGLYTHGAGTPTPFLRCVTICVPATNPPCNGTPDPDVTLADAQMEVISKVSWKDHGLSRNVELRERLYNWR